MKNVTQEDFDKREKELEKKLMSMDYFFKEIQSHTRNIAEAEDLYREMKEYIDATKSGGSFTAKIDKAKLYENLIRLRIGIGDMYAKRSNVIVTFGNFNLKKNKDEDDTDNFKQLIREFQTTFDKDETIRSSHKARSENRLLSIEDTSDLDSRVDKELKSGKLSLTKNEEAMSFDFKGVEIKYDTVSKDFVPYFSKEKRILTEEEYPRERMPKYEFSEMKNEYAITKDGNRIPVIEVIEG